MTSIKPDKTDPSTWFYAENLPILRQEIGESVLLCTDLGVTDSADRLVSAMASDGVHAELTREDALRVVLWLSSSHIALRAQVEEMKASAALSDLEFRRKLQRVRRDQKRREIRAQVAVKAAKVRKGLHPDLEERANQDMEISQQEGIESRMMKGIARAFGGQPTAKNSRMAYFRGDVADGEEQD